MNYIIKDIEELSELIQALSKNLNGEDNIDNIIEEVSDVIIAINHIKYKFNISDAHIKKIHIKKGVLNKYKNDNMFNSSENK